MHLPALSHNRRGLENVLLEVNTAVAELAERPLRLKGYAYR